MEYTQHFVGSNAVVMRDGCILLGRRKGGVGDGSWGLPGGHLDAGEMLGDCAMRELAEETGMTGTAVRFLCVKNSYQPKVGCNYVNFAFHVDAVGEPRVCEPEHCSEWGWFPLGALPTPLFFGHVKLIATIVASVPFLDERDGFVESTE